MPDVARVSGPASSGGGDFRSVFEGAVQHVESANASAEQSVSNFLSGEGGELHSTILATQRAELEFDLMVQVRNKIVSAYQEVMRMQM